jgi:formylglycine-generating enzyme required for sulfatase activity
VKVEKCANCNQVIGKFETACLYKDEVVCQNCDTRLRGQQAVEPGGSKQVAAVSNPQIATNVRRHGIFYYVFWGSVSLFGTLVILWLGFIFMTSAGAKRTPPTDGASGEKPSASGSTNADSLDRQPGKVISNSIGMKLVWIPPGEFQMGSNDNIWDKETPVHAVKITKGFYMGIYEVTQEQYQKVMGTNPSKFQGSNLPVEMVSWDDAVELPTEAEWEYACRAGTTTRFSFGDSEDQLWQYGNYCDASFPGLNSWNDKQHNDNYPYTSPVGRFKPNAFGLYDMHGNVWEYCSDWCGEKYYSSSPTNDPQGPSSGWSRVFRGGCWDTPAILCRASMRGDDDPKERYDNTGFRVVLAYE